MPSPGHAARVDPEVDRCPATGGTSSLPARPQLAYPALVASAAALLGWLVHHLAPGDGSCPHAAGRSARRAGGAPVSSAPRKLALSFEPRYPTFTIGTPAALGWPPVEEGTPIHEERLRMNRSAWIVLSLCSIWVFAQAASVEHSQALHDAHCKSCHDTSVYARANRWSPAGLPLKRRSAAARWPRPRMDRSDIADGSRTRCQLLPLWRGGCADRAERTALQARESGPR
jgi:hypothetical protein